MKRELKDKIKLVEELCEQHKKAHDQLQDIYRVMGSFDFPFAETYNRLFENQIKLVSELIGDTAQWVDWFIFENDCGARNMCAIIDGKEIKVKDVKTLVTECIIDDTDNECFVKQEDVTHLQSLVQWFNFQQETGIFTNTTDSKEVQEDLLRISKFLQHYLNG